MALSKTKPGTSRLSDIARHLVLPSGIVSTGWPAVAAKARELGLGADLWQVGAGRCILAKRADGSYAASIGGVVISIPRQVGKTYLIGLIVFCLCLLNPNLTVIWTAHQLKTAGETFRSMQAFARRKKIAPFVLHVRLGSGDEAIEFRNGARILFGARERGFGLGFTMVDVLVIDEAQRVTERTMDDLVPTTNQAPNPLILLMGTPPRPTDPGEVFRSRRAEALSGESDDLLFIEFSADLSSKDPHSWKPGYVDWELVEQANPSYPDRTPRTAILRMRKNLGLTSFLLEGLGAWPDGAAGLTLDEAQWLSLRDDGSEIVGELVYGMDVAPDRSRACIAAAGYNATGRVHVEITSELVDGIPLLDHRSGTTWLLARGRVLVKVDPSAGWVILGRSQAETFAPFLEEELFADVERVSPAAWPAACASFVDMVARGQIVHLGTQDLADAVAAAALVHVGEEQVRYGRRVSSGDISPLVAVTLAATAIARETATSGNILDAFK